MIKRYPTKKIYVGDVAIGGDAPISVQSMTYSKTSDIEATVEQIRLLHFAPEKIFYDKIDNNESISYTPCDLYPELYNF